MVVHYKEYFWGGSQSGWSEIVAGGLLGEAGHFPSGSWYRLSGFEKPSHLATELLGEKSLLTLISMVPMFVIIG